MKIIAFLLSAFLVTTISHSEPTVIVSRCDCACIDDAIDDAVDDNDIGGATALMLYYIENCVPQTTSPDG
jgi:hypothetical protein